MILSMAGRRTDFAVRTLFKHQAGRLESRFRAIFQHCGGVISTEHQVQ